MGVTIEVREGGVIDMWILNRGVVIMKLEQKSSAQKNTSNEPQNSKSANEECGKPARSHTIQGLAPSAIGVTNTVKTGVGNAAMSLWSKRRSDIEIVIAGSRILLPRTF